jgi:hypothetical protein
MSPSRLIGTLLVVVGVLVMILSPSNWPIIGVAMVVGGLALILRDSVARFRSSAPTPYSEMLWRRNAGGPVPTRDPGPKQESPGQTP